MTDDTINRLLKRARFVAGKHGYYDEAEDVAQEILCGYLEKPKSKQTVDQAFIDWIRKNGNRTRSGARRITLRDCTSIDEEITSRLLPSPRTSGERLQDFECYLIGLKDADRCIAVLRYVWNLSEQEIARCFGVTESRISQRVQGIHARVCKTIPGGAKKMSDSKRARTRELARLGKIKGARLSIYSSPGLAKSEPEEVESNRDTGFDEWLT